MSGIAALLDAWKSAKNINTDMAVAERLHVTRAAVSKWRNGNGWPAPATLARMCRDTGEDYAQWTMLMDSDRAPDETARASIQQALRVLKKYGRAAAVVLLLAGVGATGRQANATSKQTQEGSSFTAHKTAHPVYYVKYQANYQKDRRVP